MKINGACSFLSDRRVYLPQRDGSLYCMTQGEYWQIQGMIAQARGAY